MGVAVLALLGVAPAFCQTVAVLSQDDVQRYKQIFADERSGDFADAQTLVSQLSDRSLIGYAQAEHYLSDHSARTPLPELVAWLEEYPDLPIADRIYTMAVKRATVPVKKHHRVIGYRVTASIPVPSGPPRVRGGGYEEGSIPEPAMQSDAARVAQSQIMADIKNSDPTSADGVLQALVAANTATSADVARLSQHVAASYIAEGQDFNAFDVASRVSASDLPAAPLLEWELGFSAYRMGKFDVAADHLEILAQNGAVPNYIRAQGAFWAARAHLANNDPLRVVTLLTAAAREEPTFYGLLAEHMLGQDSMQRLDEPRVDPAQFASFSAIPSAHRAIALYQIGETADLHEEMARAMAAMDYSQAETFCAVAQHMNVPDLELRASEMAASNGRTLTGLYPVPDYAPPGGYHIEPSLLLAFVRIESKFQSHAVSPAGARGLMQVMPDTAAKVEGERVSESEMNDPSFSLGLGQRYLEELMDDVNGNLFETAAAYNAGPGAVTRWLAHPNVQDDPLLFLESMGAPETRDYVKRVMAYYWMYSRRMHEVSPSLDQAARGGWPLYKNVGTTRPPVVAPPPQQPVNGSNVVSDADTPH
jgi:soluble lytic murein transglycosylase-like protein